MSHHFFTRLQQIRTRYGLKQNQLPSTNYTKPQLSNFIKKYPIDTSHLSLSDNINKPQPIYREFIQSSQRTPLNLNIRATNRSFRQKTFSQNKNYMTVGCENGHLRSISRNNSQEKSLNYLANEYEKRMMNGRRDDSTNKVFQRSGSMAGSVQNLRTLQQAIERQTMEPIQRKAYSSLHRVDLQTKTLSNLNRVQQKIRTYLGR